MVAWNFLRAVAWPIGSLLIAAILIWAGSLGWLGDAIQSFLLTSWMLTERFLNGNNEAVGRLVTLTGATGTLISGTWAIYKIWHFAEHRMPQRIEEFLEHNDKRLFEAGPMLLRAIEAPGSQKPWRAPIAFVGPLNDAMRKIGFGNIAAASPDLGESIRLLKAKREKWESYEEQTRVQLANAHLLRGAVLAADAGTTSGETARKLDKDAEHEFAAAIELDSENAEAYYYRALQRLRLGQIAPAKLDFESAIEQTSDKKQSLIGSRANYCLGKLLGEEKTSPGTAYDRLKNATEQMPNDLAHSPEGAEILLLRAEMALDRRPPATTVASQCIKHAIDAVAGCETIRASKIRERAASSQMRFYAITQPASGATQS